MLPFEGDEGTRGEGEKCALGTTPPSQRMLREDGSSPAIGQAALSRAGGGLGRIGPAMLLRKEWVAQSSKRGAERAAGT